MLIAHLAFIIVPLIYHVTAAANGMQRLPAIQTSQPGAHELFATDTTSANVALQQEETFFMGEGEC